MKNLLNMACDFICSIISDPFAKLKGIIPYEWLNLECSSKDKVTSQPSKE